MKKKELLKMRHVTVVDKMIEVARTDKEKNYYLFFQAAVENDILKVSVFPKKWILRGNQRPQFEIFISKSENDFITYEPEMEAWRTAKIDMLQYYGEIYGIYTRDNYEYGNCRKIVNDYLGTGNLSVKSAILEFQFSVRKEQLSRKHRSELEEIDAVMNEVPDLPKNFESWVKKNCLEEYLMYEKQGKSYKVYCTHCNKYVLAKDKPAHNSNTECPLCKTPAIYKAWNKQKYLSQELNVGILQRLKDDTAYVLRKFSVRVRRSREQGWDNAEVNFFESRRVTLDERFRQDEYYEYGEYKYTGISRWCYEVRHAFYYYYRQFGTAVMYTPNMKKVLQRERFAKSNLKEMFLGGQGKYIDPIVRLQVLKNYPFLEYLQKSELKRLVEEIMHRDERPGLFDQFALKTHDALRLNKQNFQRMKKVDGNCSVLEILQWVQYENEKISDESLIFIRDNNVKLDYLQVDRTGLTVERAINLIKTQAKKMEMTVSDVWRAYEDYLDMAERRGMDITDEIVCKNNRMMEFHDRYLDEENRKENQKRDEEVDTKFQKIEEDYEKNTEHFAFETDDYLIRVPHKASDITNEGRFQHHCVGASDNYLSKMVNGTTYILFLRKKAMPNRPYYTLEVKYNGDILQNRSMYNRQPNIDKIKEVLGEWQKEIKKRCEKELSAAV